MIFSLVSGAPGKKRRFGKRPGTNPGFMIPEKRFNPLKSPRGLGGMRIFDRFF